MPLSFPNQTRFYDAPRRAVQFWGHDSTREAVFFVTEDALKRVQPGMLLDEPGLLSTFDTHRDPDLTLPRSKFTHAAAEAPIIWTARTSKWWHRFPSSKVATAAAIRRMGKDIA